MSKGKQATKPAKAMMEAKTSIAAGKGKMREAEGKNAVEDEELDPLMESLKRHNDAFTSLLSLIPAQFYLAPSSEGSSTSDNINANLTKSKRKQDKTIDAAEKKRQIKEAKRAKLDPDNFKNAAQIQQERTLNKRVSPAHSDEMQLDIGDDLLVGSRAGDTDSEGEDEEDEEDDDEDDDSSSATQLTSVKGSEESIEKPAVKEVPIDGIQDLRARLQAKIQGLQSKRKAAVSNGDGPDVGKDDDSVASTKDELLEERRRKRGEMRDKRRQAMKERRRVEKSNDKKGQNSAGNANKGSSNGNKAPTLLVSDRGDGSHGSMGGRTAEMSASSDLAFSSLQFGDDEGLKGKKNRHALPSDPKAALAILEARKKKEEAREAKRGEQGKDDAAAAAEKERKERAKWSKAEAAAQGVKIRDDESLLKKAAKKKDKIKEKSRKEWSDRERDLKDQAASRQKKRNENIAARKERSKKGGKGIGGKKMGGGNKKIKARAGFEGKPRHQPKGQQKSSSSSRK